MHLTRIRLQLAIYFCLHRENIRPNAAEEANLLPASSKPALSDFSEPSCVLKRASLYRAILSEYVGSLVNRQSLHRVSVPGRSRSSEHRVVDRFLGSFDCR